MVITSGKKRGLEEITEKAKDAADKVNHLISSMTLAVEEKVAIQNQIHNLARDSEYMIDRIDNISRAGQKKVLLAYREFLKENLDAVEERLKEMKKTGKH